MFPYQTFVLLRHRFFTPYQSEILHYEVEGSPLEVEGQICEVEVFSDEVDASLFDEEGENHEVEELARAKESDIGEKKHKKIPVELISDGD